MSKLKHKGYTARIEFDPDDRIFTGRIAGITDVVTFHGHSVDELEAAFTDSVDGYLATCEKLGKKPLKPASGSLMLRIDPAVHQSALAAAEAAGKSLNQWAGEALQRAAD